MPTQKKLEDYGDFSLYQLSDGRVHVKPAKGTKKNPQSAMHTGTFPSIDHAKQWIDMKDHQTIRQVGGKVVRGERQN